MDEIFKFVLFGILAVVDYYISLRLWNKGRKNIVNMDSGNLQIYAIITTLFLLMAEYWLISTYTTWFSSFIVFPLMAKSGFLDALDGRGQTAKKLDKILLVMVGVVVAFWLYGILSGIAVITSISRYLPAILLYIFGFWMIGNKDDNITKWGYGILAVGTLYVISIMGLFG